MQVTHISSRSARSMEIPGVVEDDELYGVPAVNLTLGGVRVSRAELVAALFEESYLSPEELTGMEPAELRRYLAASILSYGLMDIQKAAGTLARSPADPDRAGFLALCDRVVGEASGLGDEGTPCGVDSGSMPGRL